MSSGFQLRRMAEKSIFCRLTVSRRSRKSVPMLLRATCYAEQALEDLVERAMAGAQQGIMSFAYTPVQNQQRDLPHDSARHHHQQ